MKVVDLMHLGLIINKALAWVDAHPFRARMSCRIWMVGIDKDVCV